ncbi:MAG TPA: ComF family protein [Acetobacteraceae bacterium]|nr:ComF family protein [Acetobacteraceae bacterium]
MFRHAGRSALDLLLPPQCLCCDERVETHGLLCARCFGHTTFITDPCCVRCGVPFAAPAQALRGGLCPSCHAAPPMFGTARAALRYDSQARRLVLPLKHADRPELATRLAPYLLRAGALLLSQANLLVPVPLHRRRLFHRRYNQAALLATAVGHLSGVTAALDLLVRHRATVSLGDKSATERAEEVRDAFAIRAGRQALLPGRSVVLIDDVMTSGATANACAVVMLAGGATRVDVLIAARVPDPRLG